MCFVLIKTVLFEQFLLFMFILYYMLKLRHETHSSRPISSRTVGL